HSTFCTLMDRGCPHTRSLLMSMFLSRAPRERGPYSAHGRRRRTGASLVVPCLVNKTNHGRASCPPIAPSPRVEPLVSAAGRAARAARAALSNRRRAAGRGARGGARAPLAALAPIGAALLGDAARGGHRRAARGGGAVG